MKNCRRFALVLDHDNTINLSLTSSDFIEDDIRYISGDIIEMTSARMG